MNTVSEFRKKALGLRLTAAISTAASIPNAMIAISDSHERLPMLPTVIATAAGALAVYTGLESFSQDGQANTQEAIQAQIDPQELPQTQPLPPPVTPTA